MTTGEKLALLRKEKGITQAELSEMLNISRQSVSRWELDAAFPETDHLIKLSKLFGCSIDFLLNNSLEMRSHSEHTGLSIAECYQFIRDCGYFFLATSVDNHPKLRPFGMIYSDGEALFISTDKRKGVYSDLEKNPHIAIACYDSKSKQWIRITGKVQTESSTMIWEQMFHAYPNLKQAFLHGGERYLVIYQIIIDKVSIQ